MSKFLGGLLFLFAGLASGQTNVKVLPSATPSAAPSVHATVVTSPTYKYFGLAFQAKNQGGPAVQLLGVYELARDLAAGVIWGQFTYRDLKLTQPTSQRDKFSRLSTGKWLLEYRTPEAPGNVRTTEAKVTIVDGDIQQIEFTRDLPRERIEKSKSTYSHSTVSVNSEVLKNDRVVFSMIGVGKIITKKNYDDAIEQMNLPAAKISPVPNPGKGAAAPAAK